MLVDEAALDSPDRYEPQEVLATDISTRVGSCHDTQESESKFYALLQAFSCLKELFVKSQDSARKNKAHSRFSFMNDGWLCC